MSDTKRIRLAGRAARAHAVELCAELPEFWTVTFAPPKKSRPQENHYHKLIDRIAEQCAQAHPGLDAEDWKRLLLQQFYTETRRDAELFEEWRALGGYRMVPSLDGSSMVMLGAQSRRFSKKLASAFVEWLYAWGASHGVEWDIDKPAVAEEPVRAA